MQVFFGEENCVKFTHKEKLWLLSVVHIESVWFHQLLEQEFSFEDEIFTSESALKLHVTRYYII